jgi:hypothetical protein
MMKIPACGDSRCAACQRVIAKDAIKEKAAELWQGMTANERAGVRFGLFPHDKMMAAQAEIDQERPQDLAVALMDCATADGGMRR